MLSFSNTKALPGHPDSSSSSGAPIYSSSTPPPGVGPKMPTSSLSLANVAPEGVRHPPAPPHTQLAGENGGWAGLPLHTPAPAAAHSPVASAETALNQRPETPPGPWPRSPSCTQKGGMLSCSHSINHNLWVETTFITRASCAAAKRGLQNIWKCLKESSFEHWLAKLFMQLSVLPIAAFMTQIVFLFLFFFKNHFPQEKRHFFFWKKNFSSRKKYSRKILIQALLGKLPAPRPAPQRGLPLHRANFWQDIRRAVKSKNQRGKPC